MSALSQRLSKLESVTVVPRTAADRVATSSLTECLARIKAESKALEVASPLQRYEHLSKKLVRLQDNLTLAQPVGNGLAVSLRKVIRRTWPGFIEQTKSELEATGLGIVQAQGFSDLNQPGAQQHLDDLLFQA